jgi:8-oxo-(d)GTP phosphatase
MAKEIPSIFAAGVVLIKKDRFSKKVAIIHRPYREDWSLPKGKIEKDEIPQITALRELAEETGLVGILKNPLPSRLYYKESELKKVYYWKAELREESNFIANEEVDKLVWSTKNNLRKNLTYPDDVELALIALNQPDTSPLILLRHAQAEKRADWSDRYQKRPPIDTVRPLTKSGFNQIEKINQILHSYGIKRVISSDATRCISTVTKFAAEINQPIGAYQILNEFSWQANPSPALGLLSEILHDPTPQVVCGHRPALPEIAKFIESQVESVKLDAALSPGAMLVIHRTFSNNQMVIRHAEVINI